MGVDIFRLQSLTAYFLFLWDLQYPCPLFLNDLWPLHEGVVLVMYQFYVTTMKEKEAMALQ